MVLTLDVCESTVVQAALRMLIGCRFTLRPRRLSKFDVVLAMS